LPKVSQKETMTERRRLWTLGSLTLFLCVASWILASRFLVLSTTPSEGLREAHPAPRTAPAKTPPSLPIFTAPQIVRRAPVIVPRGLRSKDVQPGLLLLSAVLDESGKLVDVRVAHSLNPTYDAAAVVALSLWRFQPGKSDGEPARVAVSFLATYRGAPQALPTSLRSTLDDR
jgi:hypothetical protein